MGHRAAAGARTRHGTVASAIAVLLASLVLSSCDPGRVLPVPSPGEDAGVGEQARIVLGTSPMYLGDLAAQGAVLALPAGAFTPGTELVMHEVEAAPTPPQLQVIGGGGAFVVEAELPRSDELMELTLRFDDADISEDGEVAVGYLDPDGVLVVLRAHRVDLANQQVTVQTAHLSRWWPVRLTESQRIAQHVERRSTEEYVRANALMDSEAQIQRAVEEIMRDGMGIQDSRALEIVARAVISQAPGGSIALALADLDPEGFADAVLEETASVLGQLVVDPDSPVGSALGSAGSVGTALGSLAGGDPAEAARVIARELVDNTPVLSTLVSIGDTAAALIDDVVTNVWLNPEVEKAYEVYRDGAAGRFGYQVDAGDWDAVSAQMRGAMRQVRINHIEAYCQAQGIAVSSLSTEEYNRIGDEGEARLRLRFDDRIAREPELARIRAANEDLFEQLRERGLLNRSPANPMWGETADEDLDSLLRRVGLMVDRIRRDTGRFDLATEDEYTRVFGTGAELELLPTTAIAQAIWAHYSSPPDERDAAYRQVLIDWGLLEADDELDLTGTYTGTVSFEAVEVTGGADSEECDPTDVEGQTSVLTLVLAPTPEGGGTAEVTIAQGEDGMSETSALTWSADELSFSLDGLVFTGTPEVLEDETIRLRGTFSGTINTVTLVLDGPLLRGGDVQVPSVTLRMSGPWEASS